MKQNQYNEKWRNQETPKIIKVKRGNKNQRNTNVTKINRSLCDGIQTGANDLNQAKVPVAYLKQEISFKKGIKQQIKI